MADDHDTILRDWSQNAARNEEANFRFLRSLKMVDDPDRIDALARELHADAFARIDCTRCANCCKTMQPSFTEEDVSRIAAHLGLTPEALIAAHLEVSTEDGGLQTKVTPCPFLGEDGRCTIYAVRPQTCREFPYTDKQGFIWRTYGHAANTLSCPAVYRIVQGMRRHRRRHQG
jgi:Fe-S-cluster containining protein